MASSVSYSFIASVGTVRASVKIKPGGNDSSFWHFPDSPIDSHSPLRHIGRMATAGPDSLIPVERIAAQICVIRGQSVMLDSDVAALYGATTGNLNKAVSRTVRRFPEDFAFQLTAEKYESLIFQIGISKEGRRGRRKLPWVFTEQGVAMLSSVLRSDRAADVNVAIMRTFVRLRLALMANQEISRKVSEHDQQIAVLFKHVQRLLQPPEPSAKRSIAFRAANAGEG